jgi:hypothetical protein
LPKLGGFSYLMPIFNAIPAYKNDNLESQTSVSVNWHPILTHFGV